VGSNPTSSAKNPLKMLSFQGNFLCPEFYIGSFGLKLLQKLQQLFDLCYYSDFLY
jgi:hypothetical protein